MSYCDLALHTDKYQINMMYAHWKNGTHNRKTVFDAYFRKLPFAGGYAVFAGLKRIVEYVEQICFKEEDLAYLAAQPERYDQAFLNELRKFRFAGSIYAVREGTIVFPNEPLIRVEGRVFETQLIETALLNFMNYQTLIATKASRIKQTSPADVFLEFGSRRAQEADAAIWGARAAYIAGFAATSNVRAGKLFGIPAVGTHSHSWVQMFPSELEAFLSFARACPDHVTLLVDTYDTLKSGIPNAIQAAKILAEEGIRLKSVRLDSGDLAYLSIKAREMLDQAGLRDVKIIASNDLDEDTIFHLKAQGCRIDMWGVGTHLITAQDQPSLGGVYKLAAKENGGVFEPTIKISANPEKVTTPGIKEVYRIIGGKSGKAEADYIALTEEDDVKQGKRIKLFDPVHPYLKKWISDYVAVPLLDPIIVNGERTGELPDLAEIRNHHQRQIGLFWPEYLRRLNPEIYPVDLSQKTWDLRMEMIKTVTGQ
ncbi:MAG TPA: nicotinate phosphoribosyltransferase [Bacilli bacterium]